MPLIGIFIMVVWGLAALVDDRPRLRVAVSSAAVIVVLGYGWTARAQVAYWKNNVALWTHATMVTLHVDEYDAHLSLGTTLGNQGRLDEAREHFAAAVSLRPQSDAARLSLGIALAKQGRRDEAARELDEALRLNPGNQVAARLRAGLGR